MSETITCEWCAEEIPAGASRCPKCQGSISPTGRRIEGTPLAPPTAPAKPKAPAGWYDDPSMVNTRRYWDGQKWTEHRQEKVSAAPATPAAAVPPVPDPPTFEDPRDRRIGCGGVLVAGVIVIVVLAWSGVFSGGDSGGDEISAQIMCKKFVKDRLKAPSTADFANVETVSGGANTSKGGDPSFTIEGDVDSENSFGAKLRNHFSCSVYYTASDDTWHLSNLDMTEN